MPRRYVMAISCICHYRPAHKLVTAHLECRAPLRVCPLLVSSLPTPALSLSLSSGLVVSLLLSLFLPSSSSHLLPFTIRRSLSRFPPLLFLFSLFLHPTKYLPPSRLHSGGEASIVIVPHQRRSAINLSPCRAESERCSLSLSERTTLGIPVAR